MGMRLLFLWRCLSIDILLRLGIMMLSMSVLGLNFCVIWSVFILDDVVCIF